MRINKINSLIKKRQQQLVNLKKELKEKQKYKTLLGGNKDFSLNFSDNVSDIYILQQSIYDIEQELELLRLQRQYEFYKGLALK